MRTKLKHGGKSAWKLDEKYRAYYLQEAAKAPRTYAFAAAERLTRVGAFDDAEKVIGTAMEQNKASTSDYRRSVFAAAEFWRTRTDGKADGTKAVQRFTSVVENGSLAAPSSFYHVEDKLGDIYFFGQGMAPDKIKGLEWYRTGRERHNINAVRRLAALTGMGDGVAKDEEAALKMLDEVASFSWVDYGDKNEARFDVTQLRLSRELAKNGGAANANYRSIFTAFEADLREAQAKTGFGWAAEHGYIPAQAVLNALNNPHPVKPKQVKPQTSKPSLRK